MPERGLPGGCPAARTMQDGKRYEEEVYLHHKDGHRIPVKTRVAPIRDDRGDITGATEVFIDNSSIMDMSGRVAELEELSLLDPLTGVGNRRHCQIHLETKTEELNRYGWKFGILFADIDHFKQVNDSYGHDVGDGILKMVSATMLHNIRSADTLSRWGGEEFVAIISNIDEPGLAAIANKLRVLVENSSLSFATSTITVTISIGATMARPDETIDTLVKRADTLMYESKRSGRNTVTMETMKREIKIK